MKPRFVCRIGASSIEWVLSLPPQDLRCLFLTRGALLKKLADERDLPIGFQSNEDLPTLPQSG
jgi:hypothetical protein